jgi:hypothetical protein
MDCIAIPIAALDSQGYQDLTLADKYFLIELYRLFFDTERFTIDAERPQDYRQPRGTRLVRKTNVLLDAGLIKAVDLHKNGSNHYQRIFVFTYPAMEVERAA